MKKVILGLGIMFFALNVRAAAYDWSGSAKVKIIEPGYLPDRIAFTVDANLGPCAKGSWLSYYGKGSNKLENIKFMYSSLLAGFSQELSINFYGKNDCSIHSFHLVK